MPGPALITGILLAAGAGTRFAAADSSGGNKLLAQLADGRSVAEAACAALRPAVDRLIAVVRPGADELAARLAAAGADVIVCPDASRGMGSSLACAVRHAADASGWLIALADMPCVASADARRVADALRAGAAIAVPVNAGRRGHPVGFAPRFGAELQALDGDSGARSILATHADAIVNIEVTDPGAWIDVDTPADLEAIRHGVARR